MIDKYAALIVRCIDATDVIAAVTFAREQGMAVAVRSGGHSLSGHSTTDGGMLIDLSPMKAINIDRIRRIARIEPGLTWTLLTNDILNRKGIMRRLRPA